MQRHDFNMNFNSKIDENISQNQWGVRFVYTYLNCGFHQEAEFQYSHKWSPINLYERHFNQPTQQER